MSTEDGEPSVQFIAEKMPISASHVATLWLCERLAYYGGAAVFRDNVQLPGMGSRGATVLCTICQFWFYGHLIIGAIIKDLYHGNSKATMLARIFYLGDYYYYY